MNNQEPVQDAEFVQTGNVEQVEGTLATNVPEQPKAEMTPEQRKKMENQQKMFKILQQGSLFLKFIYNDIEQQKKNQLNRPQRRRFEKEINKGLFSRELVEVYAERLTEIQDYIENQLNPKEAVDGAAIYEKYKSKAEAEKQAKA